MGLHRTSYAHPWALMKPFMAIHETFLGAHGKPFKHFYGPAWAFMTPLQGAHGDLFMKPIIKPMGSSETLHGHPTRSETFRGHP